MVQPQANTELTLAFIRITEILMSLLCLIAHINSLKDEEPLPHIVLFCGTYSGFFILSVVNVILPLSGQISPPGVDLVFSMVGFLLFYAAACAAMFFVQVDPHLVAVNGIASTVDERTHPFFIQCTYHAILSITTGTLFLMHAVISGDRLASMLKGIEEDIEREITNPDDIDIHPEETISLHLFFLNWLIRLWNTVCCQTIRNKAQQCSTYCIKYFRRKRQQEARNSHRKRRRDQMTEVHEKRRVNGVTVTDIAPQEILRNPRRTLAYANSIDFLEKNKNIDDYYLENNEPHQGPSSRNDTEDNVSRKSRSNFDLESRFTRNEEFDRNDDINSETDIIWIENKQYGNTTYAVDDDGSQTNMLSKSVSFIRNVQFTGSEDSLEDQSDKNVSFVRNKDFQSDGTIFTSFKNLFRNTETVTQDVDRKVMLDDIPDTIQEKESKHILRKSYNESIMSFDKIRPIESKSILKKDKKVIKRAPSNTKLTTIKFKESFKNSEIIQTNTNKEESITSLKKLYSGSVNDMPSYTEVSIDKKESKRNLIIPDLGDAEDKQAINEVPSYRKIPSFTFEDKPIDTETQIPLDKKESKTILKKDYLKNVEGIILPTIKETIKVPDVPASNLIPCILTNTFNKDLEITLENKNVETKQQFTYPAVDSTSYMKEVTTLIPDNKISKTTSKVVEDFTYPVPDSISYMKEVANLIPTNKISQTITQTKEFMYPALDSTSFIKEVANLIPDNKINIKAKSTDSEDLSELIIEEIDYGLSLQEVPVKHEPNQIEYELDSSSYMKEISSLIPSDNQTKGKDYSSAFPKLNSTSYLQTISGLIPSGDTENASTSKMKNEKGRSTDYVKN